MTQGIISQTDSGMQIDWDVPIDMDDGITLRADIYRPVKEGQYPVINELWSPMENG